MSGTTVQETVRIAEVHYGPEWVDLQTADHVFSKPKHMYCNNNISVKVTRNMELYFPDDVVSTVQTFPQNTSYNQVDSGRLAVAKGNEVVMFCSYDSAPPLKVLLAVFDGHRQVARVRKGR